MSNVRQRTNSGRGGGVSVQTRTTPGNDKGNGGQHVDKGQRARKRRRRSTGGNYVNKPHDSLTSIPSISEDPQNDNSITSEQFKTMNTDDKLFTLFEMMSHVKKSSSGVDKVMYDVNINRQCIDENTRRIKTLEYKSIDAEARSRRNNLIFRGISESWDEDCNAKLQTFLHEKLDIQPGSTVLQRVHRLGKRVRGRSRPVIACFRDSADITRILKNTYKLQGSDCSVSKDYPVEISQARSKLWPAYKRAKANHSRGSVKLAYPAKLVVNGNVTEDEFPDWDDIMGRPRRGPVTYDEYNADTEKDSSTEDSVSDDDVIASQSILDPPATGAEDMDDQTQPAPGAEGMGDQTQHSDSSQRPKT